MEIIHLRLLDGELPVVDSLASSCVHIAIPYNGWAQQNRLSKENPTRPIVPLSDVKFRNIKRWLQDRVNRLPVKKGCLILIIRPLDSESVSIGLAHDTRVLKMKFEPFPGIPVRIDV